MSGAIDMAKVYEDERVKVGIMIELEFVGRFVC